MQTNYDTSVHPDLNGELHTAKTNPLFIPEITDHMFQFLKLSDIKNCRSVCRQWNQLAQEFLKKLSVVNILKRKHLEQFNKVFPNAQQCQIFTCFTLDGLKWPMCKFVSFCEKWYQNLSEVTLFGADFGLDKENETYDLSPLLPSTLIKLIIANCRPRMIIATDKICNIRILELEDCILNIIPMIVLSPVEVVLENVTFREYEENVEDFLINPLINLDVLKKASFSGENIMLDLQGSHSLDVLSLDDGVEVLSWETSNWEIKKLFLGVYPCKEVEEDPPKSHIKYRELEISLSNLNVSLLPVGIEKLEVYLHHDQEVPPRVSGQHNFTDLKHLHITLEKGIEFSPFVEFFKHCPKLSTLTVELTDAGSDSSDKSILKTSALPLNVKTLRLVYDVTIILDRTFQLESLILYCAICKGRLSNIVDIIKELHVKNLIWFGMNPEIICFAHRDRFIFDKYEEKIVNSLIDLNLDNFAVGAFSELTDSELDKSYVFPLVNTPEKYYMLQHGKDISWNVSKYKKRDLKCVTL